MKIYIFLILACFSFAGCGFLEESSQSEIRPGSVEDMRSLMNKDAYPYNTTYNCYLPLLTDEIESNGSSSVVSFESPHNAGSQIFCWNPNMFDGENIFTNDMNSWKMYYEKIKGCNVVKDYMHKVAGSQKNKNGVLGQVLFLRGYYYFRLASIYCQDYTNSDPTKTMGVPLILTMDVTNEFPERATLAEVYTQIEEDLLEAADLLKENYTAESVFRVGHVTAYAMLSRFYLYKGDLENCKKYADLAIKERPLLTDLNTLTANNSIYDNSQSIEILWNYGKNINNAGDDYVPALGSGKGRVPYSVSGKLISLYDVKTDLRYSKYFFFLTANSVKYPARTGKIGYNSLASLGPFGIRTGEMYVTRAEVCARLYIKTGQVEYKTQANSDLNTLRVSRYVTGTYTPINIDNGEDLLSFCMEERQREMCLEEGLRWSDIKRLQIPVTHIFVDAMGETTEYKLESGSLMYALPIPDKAIERNHKLIQNPR